MFSFVWFLFKREKYRRHSSRKAPGYAACGGVLQYFVVRFSGLCRGSHGLKKPVLFPARPL